MCREIPGWPRSQLMSCTYCLVLMILILLSIGSMFSVNMQFWTWGLFAQIVMTFHVALILICILLWVICIFTPGYQCWLSITRNIRAKYRIICLCEELDLEDEAEALQA
jgi:hypothetical protein